MVDDELANAFKRVRQVILETSQAKPKMSDLS